MSLATVFSRALSGMNAPLVEVEAHLANGLPAFNIVGLPDTEVKERIVSLFHPMCVEMEGAGIAQAAYLNKVSYVIIRAISDKADNSATMDYPEFVKMAITHYVGLVKGLVERM